MSLSRAEVEKIALLGRLLLSDEELQRMTVQLGDILGYMDLLGEVDTTNVEPMAHARDMANVFRDDVAAPSLDREAPWRTPRTGTNSATLCPPCFKAEIDYRRKWIRRIAQDVRLLGFRFRRAARLRP